MAVLLMATSSSAASDSNVRPYFEQEGLKVEMEVSPLLVTEDDIRLRFRVAESGDAAKPVSGLRPLAWLTRRADNTETPSKESCKHIIRGLLGGRLARNADVNLNEYLLITLDDNNSISIIDPQIESSKTKTLGIVSLTSKGTDFVLARDRRHVLVTLPANGHVAAADIFEKKARYIHVGGRPHSIALQTDGRLAWVGDETGETVSAIDVATLSAVAAIKTGPGPHAFAFTESSAHAYVASRGSTKLAVIDTHTLEVAESLDVGAGAVAVAYSSRSGQVYVARADGVVVVVDSKRQLKAATIRLEDAISSFAISPSGRFGFAVHGDRDKLTIIDTATNSVLHTLTTLSVPDRVQFTDSFAYVRHAGTGEYLLIDLSTLASDGTPAITPVVMGQRPPEFDATTTVAPTIAPLPEGAGVLALNGADRAISHFVEGMSAPMGSYRTYPWPARGVLISDRTIQEADAGVYETEFRLPRAGTYTLPFLVPTSPQLYGCFTLEVATAEGEAVAETPLILEAMFDSKQAFSTGRPQPLSVRLRDPTSGHPVEDLDDVMILVLGGPRNQWRGRARPVGQGAYEVDAIFPSPGQYMVMVASESRGVAFGELHSLVATAELRASH